MNHIVMKVSVVIPVFNEEAYIEDCLKSLLKQTEPADEIIVVDNNSTDKTMQIVKKYPVRILKEKTQGITPARNKGFDSAKYELIARTDADVRVPRDWIKRIKDDFKTHEIDALYGPVVFYDLPLKTPAYTKAYFDFIKQLQSGKEASLYGPNMVITKKIWLRVKDLLCTDDSSVHEDHDLGIHIAQIGGIIQRDNKLVIQTSARRMMKHPKSFFIEYPTRLVRTIQHHTRLTQ